MMRASLSDSCRHLNRECTETRQGFSPTIFTLDAVLSVLCVREMFSSFGSPVLCFKQDVI